MHLKKYWELYKNGIKKASAYKLIVAASFGSSLLYIVLLIAVWTTINASANLEGGLSRVISYIVVGQVISNSIGIATEQWFGERIRQGTIVNELKRPVSVILQSYFHELGWKSFATAVKSVPLLIVGLIFTSLELPSLFNLVGFTVSVLLSFHLMYAAALSTSMLVFWTKIDSGIRFTRSMVIDFLSGVVFPLYLLPPALEEIFYLFPFHLMVDGPINVFLMERTGSAVTDLLIQQMIWIIVFLIIAELLWFKAKKKLTVQGG